MGGGGTPRHQYTTQEIPLYFRPYFQHLYSGAEDASYVAANPLQPTNIGGLGLPVGNSPYPMASSPWSSLMGQQQQQAPSGGFAESNKAAMGAGQQQPSPTLPPVTGLNPPGQRRGTQPNVGQAFPGPFTAPTHPLELASLYGRQGVGEQLAGTGQGLLNLGQATAGGYFLSPQSNPFLAQTMQYAMQPAIAEYTGAVMPQFTSQALQSGSYKGSSARDMAAAQLANDLSRNLMGTTAAMGMQNLMAERQLQQGAGTMMDEAARLMQLSPEIMAQTGEGWRALQQRALDEALLRYQEQIQAPYRPLMPLASILQGGDIGATMTQMSPAASATSRGIAGALGGATTGATLANTLGQQGGYGAGITGLGGLLGGLAGALG